MVPNQKGGKVSGLGINTFRCLDSNCQKITHTTTKILGFMIKQQLFSLFFLIRCHGEEQNRKKSLCVEEMVDVHG